MLRLNLESAPYTELDFQKFNPEGFRRIRHAVEMAKQQKALAQSPDELQYAVNSLRAVAERKFLEQQIAQKNFELQRGPTFEALRALQSGFRSTGLDELHRIEIENQIDHLVTLYSLKNFDAIRQQLPAVEEMLRRQPSGSMLAFSSHGNFARARCLSWPEREREGDRVRETIRQRRTVAMLRFIQSDQSWS